MFPPHSPPDTIQMRHLLDRIKEGDLRAREELLQGVCSQLEKQASRMLRRFGRVRRWVETHDVLQNALVRLLRALKDVRPETMRGFFALAAEQMRRELLDLARHYQGPLGMGAHHATPSPELAGPIDPQDPGQAADARDLDRWCALHEEVARLPVEEREVVGLVLYHGWTQAAVAELLGVTVRTVQNYWLSALRTLRTHFHES